MKLLAAVEHSEKIVLRKQPAYDSLENSGLGRENLQVAKQLRVVGVVDGEVQTIYLLHRSKDSIVPV